MVKDLIIEQEYYLTGEEAMNERGAPQIQRIHGEYKDCGFILDRVYEGEYTDKDGEVYYEGYQWMWDVPAEDRDDNEIDVMEVVDLYEADDYDRE